MYQLNKMFRKFAVQIVNTNVMHALQPTLKHTKRQANQHGCLPCLMGDRDKEIEIVYGEAKIFFTGPTRAAKAEQKSLTPARQVQRTSHKGPLSFDLFESPLPQFPKSTGATPIKSLRAGIFKQNMGARSRGKGYRHGPPGYIVLRN
jgi:hypothetical protein